MKLAEALAKAQAELGNIPKDAINKHMNQPYTSAETMIEHCRKALHKHNIAVVCMKRSSVKEAGMLHSVFRVMCGEEHIEMEYDMPIVEGRGTPLDKATAAASTYTLTYFLRDLMLAPRGESIEDIGKDQEKGAAGKPEKPAPDVAERRKLLIAEIESFTGLKQTDKANFPKAVGMILTRIGYADSKIGTMDAASLNDALQEIKLKRSEGMMWEDLKTPI